MCIMHNIIIQSVMQPYVKINLCRRKHLYLFELVSGLSIQICKYVQCRNKLRYIIMLFFLLKGIYIYIMYIKTKTNEKKYKTQ